MVAFNVDDTNQCFAAHFPAIAAFIIVRRVVWRAVRGQINTNRRVCSPDVRSPQVEIVIFIIFVAF